MVIRKTNTKSAVESFRDAGLIVPERLAKDVSLTGYEDPITKQLLLANHLLRKADMVTLAPLLPMLLNLKGVPYTLKDHFPFEPFFRTRVPQSTVLKTGRQVSKSTSLASRGIVMANCIPHFSTLYLTPLYEQVRRFSQNYIRPFIETSPLKTLFSGKGTMNSVLQRSFKNRSQLLFSFAFVDAERVRGISADKVAIDESCRYNTVVDTPRGGVKIQHLIPGDLVYASDKNGKIVERKVLDNQHHGTQECYRITLSNGSVLELTSDSFVATTNGWRRVSTVVRDLVDAAASSDVAGDDVRRRIYVDEENTPGQSSIRISTRLRTARLQHREVPGIARVRKQSTREEEERRLRRLLKLLRDKELSRIAPYRCLVSSQGQETSHPDLARPDDLRGDLLVAHGRRHPAEQRHPVQHARVYEAGVYPPGFLAQAYGVSGVGQAQQEPTQPGLQIPRGDVVGGRDLQTDAVDPTVRGSFDGLQVQSAVATIGGRLSVLPEDVQIENQSGEVRGYEDDSVLRLGGVQTKTPQTEQRAVDGQPGKTGSQEHPIPGTLLRRSRGSQEGGETTRKEAQGKEPGVNQSGQSPLLSQEASGATTASLDLPGVQANRTAGGSGQPSEVLRIVPGDCDGQAKEIPRIQEADIVRVEAIGRYPVCDIEVEDCHNFFADGVLVSNCQNMDKDLLPVIMEVMSASRYDVREYAGTPLSMENTIEGLWRDSSMAEWVIKCSNFRCNHYNVPTTSHDLYDMIGDLRDDISEEKPGCICAKCGKPVHPRTGSWIHAYPEKRWNFSGYHVPQIIMPMHYASKSKWSVLLGKRAGKGNTQPHQFDNEVLGESSDTGSRMITMTDLQKAGTLGWNSTLPEAKAHLGRYQYRVMAVDWGGGGQEGVSFTTLAAMGIRPDGKIECFWGHRSLTPHDHIREAKLVLKAMGDLQCHILAHDYNGAGSLRETLIHQAGVPLEKIVPIQYVRAAASSIMTFKPSTLQHPRDHYSVDKTRSLLLTCNHIKQGWLKFFNYDYKDADEQGLLHDFLALVEEKSDSRTGKDIYTIIRDPHRIDDFAQAVNFGCCALWHMTNKWPNIASMTKYKMSQELLDAVHPLGEVEWDDLGTF